MIFVFLLIALLLVIHHVVIHPEYEFPDRAFQVSDICNHETWVLVFAALGLGVYIGQN